MKTRHTPGPWHLSNGHRIDGARGGLWVTDLDPDTGLHDARLIVAAPDMYEAIKAALREPNDAAWDMLRAAVAKVEGTH